MVPTKAMAALVFASGLALAACGDSSASGGSGGGGSDQGGSTSTLSGGGGGASSGGSPQGGDSEVGGGGATVDPCAGRLLCETFDEYAGTTELTNDQTFGPWRAALSDAGAQMNLDGAHTTSDGSALHVHIDTGATSGGRLFADGDLPVFAGNPTHVYGRMMMYIDPNGTSIHWTFFGASGMVEPSSPEAGRRATYLMSSLPRDGANTYSFVYGLSQTSDDPFHDCWFQSQTPMPTAAWTCVTFEMDSVNRHLEMSSDGSATPIAVVDDHGQGCVGDAVPGDSAWYGPAMDELYVGAWSFHAMDAPLDVWIDDLIVDDQPVPCP